MSKTINKIPVKAWYLFDRPPNVVFSGDAQYFGSDVNEFTFVQGNIEVVREIEDGWLIILQGSRNVFKILDDGYDKYFTSRVSKFMELFRSKLEQKEK